MSRRSGRVLIDLSVAPPGGAANYAAGFLVGLAEGAADHPEDLVVLVDEAWRPPDEGLLDAVRDRGVIVDARTFPPPGTWQARLRRGGIIRRARRDHQAQQAFIPREATPKVGVPHALLAHNLHAWRHYETAMPTRTSLSAAILRRASARSARRAGAVLAVTESMTEIMDPEIPIAGIVHHGCSFPEGSPRPPASPDGARTVVMVCTVMANKRIEVVIEGVAKAREQGQDLTLEVYGGVGEPHYATELERLSTRLLGASVLQGRVPVPELAERYQRADALVMGGSFESFCNPLVEAMRSGCLVVAPDCSLVNELCGDVAMTYAEGDPVDLADALTRVWDDQADRSRRGIERSREFTWVNAVEKVVEVTRSLGEPVAAGPRS